MPITQVFSANRDIIVFIYGQVFFVMGLAIALQSRRYSRLDLARSLQWLAAFGIIHGLHEWGDLFIPLQASYLDQPAIRALQIIHLVSLGASYACLFHFGIALLHTQIPERIQNFALGLPLLVLLAWGIITFFVLLPQSADYLEWWRISNALARYFIGFPASLLAAYGLRRQAVDRIAPLGAPHILQSLRVAGVALALYAIFGGLIPPPVPFFPGNVLNTVTFWEVTGVPVLLFRSAIGFVLAISIIRALEIFNLETERRIESMEQQQILTTERDRIGRELHDGAIQMVYTAGLLVESARNHTDAGTPIATRLDKAVTLLQDAIAALRRNLGELRAAPASGSLADALLQLANDPRFASFIEVKINLGELHCEGIADYRADHIAAIVNEALSNVVRHAHARHAAIDARCENGRLVVTIQDDGVGLPANVQAGYGLRNMRDRARLLGGQLDVTAAPRHGTLVTLDAPWRDEA